MVRTSERYWGLRWPEWSHEGLTCSLESFEEARPFIELHYPTIFASEPGRFLPEKMTPAKEQFFAEADVFIFREGTVKAGITIAHPTDWSTYYFRTMALLPEFRERRIIAEFAVRTAAALRNVGVQRWEAETSPGNVPMIRSFLSAGLFQTGTTSSERWGTLLRFTKFLSPEAEDCFRRQFTNFPAISHQSNQSTQ